MGVKSTVHLTHTEAIEKYVDLTIGDARRILSAQAMAMSQKQLEDTLEELNDEKAGGEGFENYIISDFT